MREENKVDWIRTENNGKKMDALPVGCVNVALAQIMGYTHQKYTPPLTFTLPNVGCFSESTNSFVLMAL